METKCLKMLSQLKIVFVVFFYFIEAFFLFYFTETPIPSLNSYLIFVFRQFYMKILESFLDNLILENFGWFRYLFIFSSFYLYLFDIHFFSIYFLIFNFFYFYLFGMFKSIIQKYYIKILL